MSDNDNKDQPQPGPVQDSYYSKVAKQIIALDRALNCIPYYGSEETRIVRTHLIGQIEALKWVQKLREI